MKDKNLLEDYYNAMKLLDRCDEETRQAIAPLLAKLIQQDSKLAGIQNLLRDMMVRAGMFEHEGMKNDLMVRGWEKTKG